MDGPRDTAGLISAVYTHFQQNGVWPKVRELQRKYGPKTNVRILAAEAGHEFVLCDQGDDPECHLTVAGCALSPLARDDLHLFAKCVGLIGRHYSEKGKQPIDGAQIQNELGVSSAEMRRAGALLKLGPGVWGSGSWAPDHSTFQLSPAEDAIFYQEVETYEDYCAVLKRVEADRARVGELSAARHAHLSMLGDEGPERSKPQSSNKCRLSDPRLDEIFQKDLSELHAVLELGAWKAAGILAGSCMEALLLDLFQQNVEAARTRWGKRWPRQITASEFLDAATAEGFITSDHRDLGSSLKRWRNLIHPAAALENREPTQELAEALVASLRLLIADLAGPEGALHAGLPGPRRPTR